MYYDALATTLSKTLHGIIIWPPPDIVAWLSKALRLSAPRAEKLKLCLTICLY